MFSFDRIDGHEKIIENLQYAVLAKRIPHAIMFSGPAGLGKKLLAKSFAKTLQCVAAVDQLGEASPCNCCTSCVTFESGNHPDVFMVKTTKTKVIGVDDVREQINQRMDVRPYRGPYKIFIVEHADTMSVAAQNALLKTIEEPARYGIVILLCENHAAFLPTILSRCVLFKLKPLREEQVEQYLLREIQLPPEMAALYAIYAQGNIGRALALLNDDAFIDMREQVLTIARNMANEPSAALFSMAAALEAFKARIDEALDILYLWYHDLAVYKETGDNRFLSQQDQKNHIAAHAQDTSLAAVLKKCDAVTLAKRQLDQYGNFQLVMLMLLLTLQAKQ